MSRTRFAARRTVHTKSSSVAFRVTHRNPISASFLAVSGSPHIGQLIFMDANCSNVVAPLTGSRGVHCTHSDLVGKGARKKDDGTGRGGGGRGGGQC